MIHDSSTVLHQVLAEKAEINPEAAAILGTKGEHFDFRSLYSKISEVASSLRCQGITQEDRVAMVFPEGPAAALAFLSISACSVCAPLNPNYSERDFEFYLKDLSPKAALLPDGLESPVIGVAERLGIKILRVREPNTESPICFELVEESSSGGTGTAFQFPESDATAMILHTSGTTSRPKIVPLSHANLFASAVNIMRTLELSSQDRTLNVMPLFHIHGIVGGLLSSLVAGGSVICAPGYQGERFFNWAREMSATWYSAVPTIHQAALAELRSNPELVEGIKFRLIRSSSSALPPTVFHEMEKVWKVPIIESYGMTEASHQMASNCLPPRKRKPGSVGVPAGPEIVILDDHGNPLPQGETGEISIRGASVTSGYLANPEANAKSFTSGWFRTGDQGRFDEDGYLFLTGRLKEIINRGGEHIAPKEIDEVLLDHPAVAQAVAFAVPHETLGEDLAAAVVKRQDTELSELELREFLAERVAGFKVPTRIVFVASIPKGPTGKIQRIGLYNLLKEQMEIAYEAGQSEEERHVAEAFAKVLGCDRVGREDNFFYLGGDSLKAKQALLRLGQDYDIEFKPGTLFRYPSPALLGAEVARLRAEEAQLDELAKELQGLSPDETKSLLG